MDDANWQILLVEDDEDDYFLVKSWLSQVKNGQFSLKWASSYETALEMITSEPFDVVLVDYHLGSRTGLEFIQEAVKECRHVPFILLTGQGNYEVDLTAMEAGASDYLSKIELNGSILERSIRYTIEQKRSEKELHKAYEKVLILVNERTEELIETRRRLIDSIDAERKRMAQEIHDGPIQDLLGVTLLMWGKAGTVGEEEMMTSVQGAISHVVDSLREVCKELRSSSITPFNLAESICTHADDFQRAHPELAVSVEAASGLEAFPERSRLALYRIYQQAMANIAFHARANKVHVSLTHQPEKAVLEIKDNGAGFVIPERLSDLAQKGHFGLVGSMERATAVGGELQIQSAPGQGTLIRAIIPNKSNK